MWSGQRDSNPRPSAPKADALPDCAMPRAGPRVYNLRAGIVAGSNRTQHNAALCDENSWKNRSLRAHMLISVWCIWGFWTGEGSLADTGPTGREAHMFKCKPFPVTEETDPRGVSGRHSECCPQMHQNRTSLLAQGVWISSLLTRGLLERSCLVFYIGLFGNQIRRLPRSGFVFPHGASIGKQCSCLRGLDLGMAMDDDHPMSMADGVSHFLFNVEYFFRTVEIACTGPHHAAGQRTHAKRRHGANHRPHHQQPNATRQCDASDKHQPGDRAQCCTLQNAFCGFKRLPIMSELFLPMLLLSPEQTDLVIRKTRFVQ